MSKYYRKQDIKEGDRFKWKLEEADEYLYIMEIGANGEVIPIEVGCDFSNSVGSKNMNYSWWGPLVADQWEYLGNFSKKDNFTTLYDLLNNP